MDLKLYILSHVDPATYYSKRFPDWDSRGRALVRCPFHEDTTPSLSVGLENGGAKCHAASCGMACGNIVHFDAVLRGVSEDSTPESLYAEFIRPVVEAKLLDSFRHQLSSRPAAGVLGHLSKYAGLTVATLQQYHCGYDAVSNRLVIPVFNSWGLPVNLRFYKPRGLRTEKDVTIYNLRTGKGTDQQVDYGGNELFPWKDFRHYNLNEPVFLMASEKETMLARQLGMQAVCSTAGEGSWEDNWNEYFMATHVVVLFDPDTGGRTAAKRIVEQLQSIVSSIRPLELPFPRGYRGDTDFDSWVVHAKGTKAHIDGLLRNETPGNAVSIESPFHEGKRKAVLPNVTRKPPVTAGLLYGGATSQVQRIATSATTGPKEPTPYPATGDITLADIRSNPSLLNHTVVVKALIAAATQRSFDIPWKFKLVGKQGPPLIWTMPVARELLAFINATDKEIDKIVRMLSGRDKVTVEAMAYHPVLELEAIPITEDAEVRGDETGGYTVQRCYSIGCNVATNTAYELKMVPTTMPSSQEKVGIITQAVETSRGTDAWVFNDDDFASFLSFTARPSERRNGVKPAPLDTEEVTGRLDTLVEELADQHTHIYERPDWHKVAILTWFSPLQWNWPGDSRPQRGWLNSLALGDTKTGKSEVTTSLQRLLKIGEFVNSENCTYVGLVGGAIKGASGQLMLRWGRLPLGDKKLVVLEELSGLSVEEIARMSDVRSSGVARLDKGGLAGSTWARTRLLCLSNVRSKRKQLHEYLSGVEALQLLVGHAEDISRFDLVITLVDNEVESSIINSRRSCNVATYDLDFPVNAIQRLCRWVWSLRPSQIRFTDDAVSQCYALTEELGHEYHSGVPLFKPSSDRYKIARIAASIACLQFNWNGTEVEVEPAHMEAAANLLCELFDKPSLGYKAWSNRMYDREEIKDIIEITEALHAKIPNQSLRAKTLETLIHSTRFSRDELAATGSLSITAADSLIGTLFRERAIRKGEANIWEITQAGKKFFEKEMRNVTLRR